MKMGDAILNPCKFYVSIGWGSVFLTDCLQQLTMSLCLTNGLILMLIGLIKNNKLVLLPCTIRAAGVRLLVKDTLVADIRVFKRDKCHQTALKAMPSKLCPKKRPIAEIHNHLTYFMLFLNLCDLSLVTLTYLLLFVRRNHERYFDNLYYFCYYFKWRFWNNLWYNLSLRLSDNLHYLYIFCVSIA